MANGKKGLTPLGWLMVAGGAAFLLGSKARREKALGYVRDLAARFTPAEGGTAAA
jgi:hypothetical protein